MEAKRKSRQVNEIKSREIRSKGNNKRDFNEIIKVR